MGSSLSARLGRLLAIALASLAFDLPCRLGKSWILRPNAHALCSLAKIDLDYYYKSVDAALVNSFIRRVPLRSSASPVPRFPVPP